MLDNTGKPIDRHPDCPRCRSSNTVKNGVTKYGKQQWLCRDCGKQFNRKR